MTANMILTLILIAPVMLTAAGHAIVWAFYPEAR